MHVAMPIDNKGDRVHFRIREDIKDDARALAEHLGFGGRGLSSMLTYLLVEAIKDAKKKDLDLFEDAKKRVSGGKIARVAVAPPANLSERKTNKRISTTTRTRAASGGRKR